MHSFKSLLFVAVFAAEAYAAANPSACYADNCLRALRGLASKSYSLVSSDCSNYVYSTASPPAVTVYDTATVSVVVTLPSDAPYTATEETRVGIKIETVYDVVTETSSGYSIVTVTGDRPVITVTPEKRALAETSPVPSYAAACTSGGRYASACSCFGVPASIATVGASTATSTTTVSVTETVYTTNSVAVDTEYVTVPAGTSTSTVISTTTVVADVATNTVFALLEVEGGHSDGRIWLAQVTPFWQFYWSDTAHPIVRDHDGRVYFGQLGARWYGYCEYTGTDPDLANDAVQVHFTTRGLHSSDGTLLSGTELYCDFGANDSISCSCTTPEGHWTKFMYGLYAMIQLTKEDYVYRPGEAPLTFKVVKPTIDDYCGPNTQGNVVCEQYWDASIPYTYKKRSLKVKKRRLLN